MYSFAFAKFSPRDQCRFKKQTARRLLDGVILFARRQLPPIRQIILICPELRPVFVELGRYFPRQVLILRKLTTNKTVHLLEPFFTGSHQQWAEGWQRHSRHNVQLFTLPGRHWKWRMYGGAVALAEQWRQHDEVPDVLVATDMLALDTFLGLTRRETGHLKTVLYFHENQLVYPWSTVDPDRASERQNQYAYLNFRSALAADQLWFNSHYHHDSFFERLPPFLRQFPDFQSLDRIDELRARAKIVPLGIDLSRFDRYRPASRPPTDGPPIILWNHRWEYDKNPELFFKTLFRLQEAEINFRIVILGEQFSRTPPVFETAKKRLAQHILHWGYADFPAYAKWLHQADILPVTSNQDFFGISAVEAMYCGVYPLLPNRLAFPEHLSPQETNHLYATETELYQKLAALLQRQPNIRYTSPVVSNYDWNEVVHTYDDLICRIVKE